jgi:hypothetical protein
VQNNLVWSFQADFGPRFWFFSSFLGVFGSLKLPFYMWNAPTSAELCQTEVHRYTTHKQSSVQNWRGGIARIDN